MKRLLLVAAALGLCGTVGAAPVQVLLVAHNHVSAAGGLATLAWDGSVGDDVGTLQFDYGAPAGSGWVSPSASTATWTWDHETGVLASSGVFWSTRYTISQLGPRSLLGFKVTDMQIDTAAMTTSATAYQCNEGTFPGVFLSLGFCAGVQGVSPDLVTVGPSDPFRPTLTNLEYNVGGDAGVVSRTIAGLESSFTDPLSLAFTFSLHTIITDEGPGGILRIANQADICFSAEECSANPELYDGATWLTFTIVPVPGAAWLFGSGLLGLGWLRQRRMPD